eukprot:8738290-Alexandrium_andersonii.AAC.1
MGPRSANCRCDVADFAPPVGGQGSLQVAKDLAPPFLRPPACPTNPQVRQVGDSRARVAGHGESPGRPESS